MKPKTMSISLFKGMSTAAIQQQLQQGDIIITSGNKPIAAVGAYKTDSKGNYIRPATLGGKAISS